MLWADNMAHTGSLSGFYLEKYEKIVITRIQCKPILTVYIEMPW